MNAYKAKKHGMGEYLRKIPDDGKERDKQSKLVRLCKIYGCPYKTGIMKPMTGHKADKHNIDERYVIKIPNDGKERNKQG